MKLTKVIINNFRSFGESQIIELNNKGTQLHCEIPA